MAAQHLLRYLGGLAVDKKEKLAQTKEEFVFCLLRHFGHLFHSCIKTRQHSVH